LEEAILLEQLPHHGIFIYRELVGLRQRNQIVIGIEEPGSGQRFRHNQRGKAESILAAKTKDEDFEGVRFRTVAFRNGQQSCWPVRENDLVL
jgi:hypothetical protein